MTKANLVDLLVSKRAELDAALANVPVARLTQPGAVGLWSVKDILAHITYHERWVADRLEEIRQDKVYTLSELDQMDANRRNYIEYQQFRDLSLAQVQAQARQTFQDLVAALRAHDTSSLFAERRFHGSPQPVVLHDLLRSKVIDHYGEHLPSLLRMTNT